MTTYFWCPECARPHGDDEITRPAGGSEGARCRATGALVVPPAPLDSVPPAGPAFVSLTPRPKLWHCSFCGWRCESSWNDYLCEQCRALRPFVGGSATMVQCDHCGQWNLALARFCEWCGARVGLGLPPPEPATEPVQDQPPGPGAPEPALAQPAELYGIAPYPGATLLGEQHIVSEDASILWHAFTSTDAPDQIVAHYLEQLGPEGFSPEGPGGSWRWPADDPARVLHILPVDDLGPHQQLTGKPPSEARSVLVVSQRFVD